MQFNKYPSGLCTEFKDSINAIVAKCNNCIHQLIGSHRLKSNEQAGTEPDKAQQSWDLAKLLLSYITSVSNLIAFIFDISFCAARFAGVSWF